MYGNLTTGGLTRPYFSLGLLLNSTWFVDNKVVQYYAPSLFVFFLWWNTCARDFLAAVNKIRSGHNPLYKQRFNSFTFNPGFFSPILRQQAQQNFRNLEFRSKILEFSRKFLRFYSKNGNFWLNFPQNCRIFEFICEICLSLAKNSWV